MEIRGILLITITIITHRYPIHDSNFLLYRYRCQYSSTFHGLSHVHRFLVPLTVSSSHKTNIPSLYPSFLPSFLPSRIQSSSSSVGRANFFLSNHRGLLPYHSPVSLIQGDSAPRESQPPPISSEKKIEKRKGARERERCVEATVKITD